MLGPLLLGACACALVISQVGSRAEPLKPAGIRDACTISIVLVEPDGSTLSRAINTSTGSLGFSHAALDACELDADGKPVVIDCRPGFGVDRRHADWAPRRAVRVYLAAADGAQAYGCARAKLGTSFDALAIFGGSGRLRRGTICSELVADCLPDHLRDRITAPSGRPIAPNDIARAFGVTGPDSPDVIAK